MYSDNGKVNLVLFKLKQKWGEPRNLQYVHNCKQLFEWNLIPINLK